MEITNETLLSIVGIGLVTAIVLQLLIKPWLTKWYGGKPWHDIAMNVAATILAVTLGLSCPFTVGKDTRTSEAQ